MRELIELIVEVARLGLRYFAEVIEKSPPNVKVDVELEGGLAANLAGEQAGGLDSGATGSNAIQDAGRLGSPSMGVDEGPTSGGVAGEAGEVQRSAEGCPICERFGKACDSLPEEWQGACWGLLALLASGVIDATQFAEMMRNLFEKANAIEILREVLDERGDGEREANAGSTTSGER